jgi:uncharacterized membrane protein YjfL (UPF0719 family)
MGYIDALSNITSAVSSVAQNITLGKFIKWIIALIVLGAIVFYIVDRYSSTFYFNKVERKLGVIENIQKLGAGDSAIQTAAKGKLLHILNEIDAPGDPLLKTMPPWMVVAIKILGGILLPLLFVLTSFNKPDAKDQIVGGVAMILFFGGIAAFLPTFGSVWVNFIAMPILQVLLLIPVMIYQARKGYS